MHANGPTPPVRQCSKAQPYVAVAASGVAQAYARSPCEKRSLGEADATRASEPLRGLGQSPEPVVVL